MMSLPIRFSTVVLRAVVLRAVVVLTAATLSLGCAAEVDGDTVGEDLAALSAPDARAAWFHKHVELYGETFYGASTPGIPFNKGDKRYKSFSFVGQAGDKVSVRVWAP